MLFGQSRDPERYKHVITACALDPDIEVLPAGDLTEIGEKVRNVFFSKLEVVPFHPYLD